ncbi:cell division protein FtsL [Xanthobacter sediminis]|uniref:cell division protein FtsL n=1 Tax=Xanthobacter sediminis TaxID=3119926 RepID=UPI003728A43E
MFRVANILMVGALLVTAVVVYQLKYASTAEAERLATLRSQIRKERDAIAVMRAEWARRTSPFYIQGLVERHLDLKRLDVESISALDDLPPKPGNGGDGIGGIIEALEDAPLVTSSTGRASTPTPNGGAPAATGNSGAASIPATSAIRQKPAPKPAPGGTPVASTAGPLVTGSVKPRPPSPAGPAPAAATAAEPEADTPVATFFKGFLSGR